MTQVTAFQVKGIGHNLDKPDGTLWYSGPAEVTYGDFAWVRVLTEHPNENETSATPGEGELQLSSYSPNLDLQKSVHETFLARQTQPSFQLQAGISDTANTITLNSAGLLSAPTDIYIGSETMKVTQDNGDGTYDVDRGFWSSDAISHGVNAGVFERPPYYKWRLVVCKSFGSDGTLYDRWFGYLDERPVQKFGTQLKLSCEEAYKLIDGAEVNSISPKLSLPDKEYHYSLNYETVEGNIESQKIDDWDSNISKSKDRTGVNWVPTDGNYTVFWSSWIPRDGVDVDGGSNPEKFLSPIAETDQIIEESKQFAYGQDRGYNGPKNAYNIYVYAFFGPL